MAIGATVSHGMKFGSFARVIAGSVKSDWVAANTDLSVAQSAAELLRPASVAVANVIPITIPPGAMRVLVCTRRAASATTLTTHPVLRLLGADANGKATRLDATTSNAAGQTSTATANDIADGTYLWSAPLNLTGFDLIGSTTLYVLVEAAANYSASATVNAFVLFLT